MVLDTIMLNHMDRLGLEQGILNPLHDEENAATVTEEGPDYDSKEGQKDKAEKYVHLDISAEHQM